MPARNPLTLDGASFKTENRPLSTCYCYDYDIELYYLQSRYYSAEIGRFINTDDTQIAIATMGTVLGANLFAYCENNPVNDSDPNGYISLKEIGNTIKKIFTTVYKAIKSKIKSFIKDFIGYKKNGYVYIRNSLVANIIDTIIYASSNAITGAIKKTGFKAIFSSIKSYAKKNYVKVDNFFKNNLIGKFIEWRIPDMYEFTLKNIVKTWGGKVAIKFGSSFIINVLTKNFTVYNVISNLSSFGSIVAFVYDIFDGSYDDCIKIKVK